MNKPTPADVRRLMNDMFDQQTDREIERRAGMSIEEMLSWYSDKKAARYASTICLYRILKNRRGDKTSASIDKTPLYKH